jgi:hypothetical protein
VNENFLSVRRWFCRHQIEIVEKPFNLPQLGFGAGQAILKHDDFWERRGRICWWRGQGLLTIQHHRFSEHSFEMVEERFYLLPLPFGAGQAILKQDNFLDWIFASIQLASIGNNGWSETFRDVQGFGGFSRLPLTLNWGTGAFAAPLFSRGQFAVLFLFASHTSR